VGSCPPIKEHNLYPWIYLYKEIAKDWYHGDIVHSNLKKNQYEVVIIDWWQLFTCTSANYMLFVLIINLIMKLKFLTATWSLVASFGGLLTRYWTYNVFYNVGWLTSACILKPVWKVITVYKAKNATFCYPVTINRSNKRSCKRQM
jgi:hypothetical protein